MINSHSGGGAFLGPHTWGGDPPRALGSPYGTFCSHFGVEQEAGRIRPMTGDDVSVATGDFGGPCVFSIAASPAAHVPPGQGPAWGGGENCSCGQLPQQVSTRFGGGGTATAICWVEGGKSASGGRASPPELLNNRCEFRRTLRFIGFPSDLHCQKSENGRWAKMRK